MPPRTTSRSADPAEAARTTLSKLLSKILRHKAADHGVRLRPDGFARLSDLLSLPAFKKHGATVAGVVEVVEKDAKTRFTLRRASELDDADGDGDDLYIRANQGHSIAAVSGLELELLVLPGSMHKDCQTCPIPTTVLHGTYRKTYLEAIRTQGLSRMKRNHIHLATGLPASFTSSHSADTVRSGVRHNTDTFIHIDVAAAIHDGIEFWRSSNGVILTSGDSDGCLSPVYFTKVVDRAGRPVELNDQS